MVLYLSTISLLTSHWRWVHPKYTWSRKDVGSPKTTSLLSSFHIGSRLCFFPANFMSSTYTDKNNPFSRWTKRHSQFGIFSHPCFNRTFSNCLRFRSRGTTGSSILDHDLGHLCRGKLACILEADESTRMRMGNSIPQNHEDHVAGKGENSLQLYNLVHKFIPMPQAMKIPEAKAAVDKEWEKLEKISAWNLTKVKSKKKVIDEARMSGATVHFASLMDICHLKNAELEATHQKYKGRVVFRVDIVKDDLGSYAVFTEQGSSASQMTAAKVMDIISRLPRCARQAADAVSAYTQVKNEKCSQIIENSKIGMSRHLDSSTTTQIAKIMVQYGTPSRSSWTKSARSSFGRTGMGKAIWENPIQARLGEGSKLWMPLRTPSKKDYSYLCMWMTCWKETKH